MNYVLASKFNYYAWWISILSAFVTCVTISNTRRIKRIEKAILRKWGLDIDSISLRDMQRDKWWCRIHKLSRRICNCPLKEVRDE